jgi:hypothetical protein
MKKILAIISAFVVGGITIALSYAPSVLAGGCRTCDAMSSN